MDLDSRCQPIELMLSEVDGVLTDGRLIVDNQGIETKQFHVRDSMAVRLWQKAGYRFGVISSRSSQVVKMRAAELEIDIVRQGSGNKLATARGIMAEFGLTPRQVCYLGDELSDVPVLRAVGLAVAVADACEEARQAAHYRTTAAGGAGAVREVVELVLKAQRRWEDVIQPYLT